MSRMSIRIDNHQNKILVKCGYSHRRLWLDERFSQSLLIIRFYKTLLEMTFKPYYLVGENKQVFLFTYLGPVGSDRKIGEQLDWSRPSTN